MSRNKEMSRGDIKLQKKRREGKTIRRKGKGEEGN
jgi:hypothetical protein